MTTKQFNWISFTVNRCAVRAYVSVLYSVRVCMCFSHLSHPYHSLRTHRAAISNSHWHNPLSRFKMLSIAPSVHIVNNVYLARLYPAHLINQRVAKMCVVARYLLLLLFENKRSEIHWENNLHAKKEPYCTSRKCIYAYTSCNSCRLQCVHNAQQ